MLASVNLDHKEFFATREIRKVRTNRQLPDEPLILRAHHRPSLFMVSISAIAFSL
jgi:hypothetical protein